MARGVIMDSLDTEYFFVYFKDLQKKCRKKLVAYLKEHEVDDLDPVISGEMPIIVIGYQDDAESMVS